MAGAHGGRTLDSSKHCAIPMTETRYTIFLAVAAFVIALLCLQLFRLQIIKQDDASEVARGNALRTHRVIPARGAIFDRHGTLMVHNEPTYTVTLTPRYFNPERVPLLADLLDVDESVVIERLEEARQWNPYRSSPSFPDVPFKNYSRLQEDIFRLPGVSKEVNQKRRYLTSARAAHALGYVSEITREELASEYPRNGVARYRQGDFLGKTGVERGYETFLRGVPGSARRIVNVHGVEVGSYRNGLEDEPPREVYDIHLALDAGVQALAESLFVNKRGALVALDPADGGIIALVSAPDFHPDIFAQHMESDAWRALNTSPLKPLYNRATMNRMPPGSTWKPFMALMALSEGLITEGGPDGTIYCPGYHPVGQGRIFRCLGAHGNQNVVSAIKNSCNTFFFEVARRMNLDAFQEYSNAFGFGITAPMDLLEQTPGLIPDSAYFNARYASWGIGSTMNLGIGQGDMGVTPMQMARYAAAVANGGTLHTPRLVSYLENVSSGERQEPPGQPESTQIPIDSHYFDLVREGMRQVMASGSGRFSQIPDIASGGKTGTAQAPGNMPDHSVFVMFAPFENPRIAIAVQCENAGFGHNCAAPIASLTAERYLKGDLPNSWQVTARRQRVELAQSAPLLQTENPE